VEAGFEFREGQQRLGEAFLVEPAFGETAGQGIEQKAAGGGGGGLGEAGAG